MRILVSLFGIALCGCGGSKPQPTPGPTHSETTPPAVEHDAAPVAPAAQPKPDRGAEMVKDLAAFRFAKLGNPVLRWDHIPPVRATRDRPHKLLVVLVEFADRGFVRFRGKRNQGAKLAAYYQKLLFDEEYKRVNTLSHYYYDQSLGAYHVTGKVLPPIKLSKKRAAYGMPTRPAGGSWRNDADPEGMVEEALALASKTYKDLAWDDFDRWDPRDYDKDGNRDEPDGYLDHFVLVFAGQGQASCQLLNKLDRVFTPNAKPDAIAKLTRRQRECAERMWPHRFSVQKREQQGPQVGGKVNRRGGAPLSKTLWAFDYNMQAEYIGPAIFIHEFGHSLGLPDVYSRGTSNSTGGWEVMASTTSHSPQSLSAWSRMQLGWLRPKVVLPPAFGGKAALSARLQILDGADVAGTERAVMVVLPPKKRVIDLTRLPPRSGKTALYSGQGNEMNRTAELRLDLSSVTAPKIELTFDAWWEIEAGWDFAYLEVSTDGGKSWARRVPANRRHMPAKHGHDGKGTVPGFTGLSGDLDGDGKNESNPACDPKKKLPHGDDKASAKKAPCQIPTWVAVRFDLSDLRGKKARVRLRYFTDGAAVMNGILIDNVAVTGLKVHGDFEAKLGDSWHLDGFSKSSGRHELLVPHYYLLEYRDPHTPSKQHRYDTRLADDSYGFYWNPETKKMNAAKVRTRSGVVLWYYNGAYAWSENDPGTNGPGQGYLLVVDSDTNELSLPGLSKWVRGKPGTFGTYYDVKAPEAQEALRTAFFRTVCFVRSASYLSAASLPPKWRRRCSRRRAQVERIRVGNKPLMYSYQVNNDYLPGPARQRYVRVNELLDQRMRKGKQIYGPRRWSLRYHNTEDAPFAAKAFPDAVTFYEVKGRRLRKLASRSYPARASFDDSSPARWQNPKLPFGGVAVPKVGFGFEVVEPPADAPAGTMAEVKLRWK